MKMLSKVQICALAAFATAASVHAQTVLDQNLPEIIEVGTDLYEITDDLTLTVAGSPYIMEGTTIVTAGNTLTIEPGVILRGQPRVTTGDIPGSLIVARGGRIDADGTVTDPIIFTTAATTTRDRWTGTEDFLDADPATNPLAPMSGTLANVNLWGGVVLLGYAPTNLGDAQTGVAGEGIIEGFGLTGENFTYGGRNPNDDSGTLRYVSIRHTGNTVSAGDEVQGLTIGGAGYGTELEYIDIYCSGDDGIEIFGGTSALKYFMIGYANDDALDLDQGYTGFAQFGFILGSSLTGSGTEAIRPNSLAEWDGDDGEDSISGAPFGHPTFYNLTFFGTGTLDVGYGDGMAFRLRNSFGGNVYNSIIAFIPQTEIFFIGNSNNTLATDSGFPSTASSAQVTAGTLNFAGTLWWDVSGNDVFAIADTDGNATVTTDILQNNVGGQAPGASKNRVGGAANNPFFAGSGTAADANDQTVLNGLNPVPLNASAVGSSHQVTYTNTFFEPVTYIGAFEPSGLVPLWTTGWTAMNIRGILVSEGND